MGSPRAVKEDAMADFLRRDNRALLLAGAFLLPTAVPAAWIRKAPSPPARVTGIVVREDGSPVRGALDFSRFGWRAGADTPAASIRRTTTGDDGRFTLDMLPWWLSA